ncbi:hypothetical protein PR048_004443 [Dryococelus australis]|uniref:HTH CENPB-type domain-containing protein n=1 Tax=Dryococelus australis TaxID=614101 RepID=A0ABQ9I5G5_9NEOP|nr:hypothetical protein PR048_004443 [Dryococelus australis]
MVDKLTYEWFCRARSNNIPLSGPLIREKALEIAKETGFVYFKALWDGWTNSVQGTSFPGVPDAQGFRGFEMAVDGDSVELSELLKQFGESAGDYASFDDDVQTEDPSTDIEYLVASIQESSTTEENENVDDDTNSLEEEAAISNVKQAIELTRQWKFNFLNKGDADGLKMMCDVEIHLEKQMLSTKQTAIDDFFA